MMAPLSINGERLIGMASERFNADFCWATDHV
jgi:hypothetical protein